MTPNPRAIVWTDAMNTLILTERANRTPWKVIGRMLGIGRSAAHSQGKVLGLVTVTQRVAPVVAAARTVQHGRREPLPAGDPASWGLISSERWTVEGVA